MTRLPHVTGRMVVRALERAGFQVTHWRGSHAYLRKGDAPGLVAAPVHSGRDLPPGTFMAIPRQAGITVVELVDLL